MLLRIYFYIRLPINKEYTSGISLKHSIVENELKRKQKTVSLQFGRIVAVLTKSRSPSKIIVLRDNSSQILISASFMQMGWFLISQGVAVTRRR